MYIFTFRKWLAACVICASDGLELGFWEDFAKIVWFPLSQVGKDVSDYG